MQNMDAPLHFGQRKLVHQIILRGLSTNIIISTIFGIMHKPLCQQIWYYGNRTLSTQIQLNDCTSIRLIRSMQLYMYIQREKLRTCKQITDKKFCMLIAYKGQKGGPMHDCFCSLCGTLQRSPDHYFPYGPKCMTAKIYKSVS